MVNYRDQLDARAIALADAIEIVKHAAPAKTGGWSAYRAWALTSVPALERLQRAAEKARDAQPAPEPVKVKPLEWMPDEGEPGRDVLAQPDPYHRYVVRHLSVGRFDLILETDLGSKWFRPADGHGQATYAEAKAIAQIDYDKRRAALKAEGNK